MRNLGQLWCKTASKVFLSQVVADASDGSVLVDAGEGQTLRLAHAGRTARDLRQFLQVLSGEQIWGKKKHEAPDGSGARFSRRATGATCRTCGVEGAFVSVVRPLLQQPEGLTHVVCRSHSQARVTARLLQQTEGVVRAHHLLTHPPQTPGGRTRDSLEKAAFV